MQQEWMEKEDEVNHPIVEKYAGCDVIQEHEADQRNRSQDSELSQSDTIKYGLEVHVCFRPDASAQNNDCVIYQVKVHVFGVAFENDVIR